MQIFVGEARAPLRIGGDVVAFLDGDFLDVGVVRQRVGDRLVLGLGDETLPSGPYQAGIWWPHQSWREMHQGWMFSIQLKKVASHCFGTNTVRRSRTAAIAGCASVLASTYH